MRHATPVDLMRRWQMEGPRPRTLQAVVEWVAAMLRTQQAPEAAGLLRKLLAVRGDPALWGFLAQAETAAGNPGKAAEALLQHLKLEPRPQPAVYVAAVDAFVEAGKRDRARVLAERAPTGALKAFLLQRLKQDTGRAPRAKAAKSLKALAAWERERLMQVLSNLPLEVVAAALGPEPEAVQGAFLDCFSGGPRRRLGTLLGRPGDAKARALARKRLLQAAQAMR